MIIPITQIRYEFSRSRVPGGWLVTCRANGKETTYFYPDEKHKWDGFVSWNDEFEAGFLHD